MTKISVVIPSYNHASFIEAALQSLSDQTFRDFDVVIVDDGSSDDSLQIIQGWIGRSRMPVTLLTQSNAGADTALNRGIEASRGEIIAILNSDDVFHPKRLEKMLEVAPRQTPFLAFSQFEFIGETGFLIPDDPHNIWYREALAEYEFMPSVGSMLILSNISVSTSNYIFSRSLYDVVGPFRNFKTAHDLDFLLRCVCKIEPFFVRSTLLQYRIHGRNTINLNRDVEYREVRIILDDYIRAVTARAPENALAPGARQMPLYSEYLLSGRDHWSGPLAHELRQALSVALDTAPTRRDALAFRREVDRLTAELRRGSSVPAALAAALDRANQAERDLQTAEAARASVFGRLEALQASASWRMTAPVRQIARAGRALLALTWSLARRMESNPASDHRVRR